MAAMLVYITMDANEKSFVHGTPTWRRWRHVQTKNNYVTITVTITEEKERICIYIYIFYLYFCKYRIETVEDVENIEEISWKCNLYNSVQSRSTKYLLLSCKISRSDFYSIWIFYWSNIESEIATLRIVLWVNKQQFVRKIKYNKTNWRKYK
jgi:hypothetical protein